MKIKNKKNQLCNAFPSGFAESEQEKIQQERTNSIRLLYVTELVGRISGRGGIVSSLLPDVNEVQKAWSSLSSIDLLLWLSSTDSRTEHYQHARRSVLEQAMKMLMFSMWILFPLPPPLNPMLMEEIMKTLRLDLDVLPRES